MFAFHNNTKFSDGRNMDWCCLFTVMIDMIDMIWLICYDWYNVIDMIWYNMIDMI